MIYEVDIHIRKRLFSMFKNMRSTIILSCLQGHMGKAWVDDLENPSVAQIQVGDFVYYAGDPHRKEALELLHNLPENTHVIVHTDDWKNMIEMVHKGSIEKFHRYQFKKNPKDLNRNHIQTFIATLPDGYVLKKIDSYLANEPSLHRVSRDFTGQFESIDDYMNRGIGFAILYEGEVVCGASSYSIYDDGIEIEVATDPKHRRKGLAAIAAAALILECLDRGIYPSWDAANSESAHLAQRLGYILEEAYDTYFINYKK
ncbi:GNAT family N-acetyltransferase [Bacillus sp. CGMCC 1.16607]|uniref:GNAT family N-acetyltransferase n=1 Tax=Bacillus sp. CGMCC 1.16607 TaxID=3351842 RepID=UPI00363D8942